MGKLTEFDAIRVRVLLKMGMDRKTVSRIFGISVSGICNIANGIKWKRVKKDWTLREFQSVVAAHQNEWRLIPGIEHKLWAHPSGRIRNDCLVLKATPNYKNYLLIRVGSGATKRTYAVHRLIAATFLGAPPEGMQVHHKDSDPSNPALDNLEYVTPSQNVRHAVLGRRHNCIQKNQANHNTVVSDLDCIRMKSEFLSGDFSRRELARKYGIGYEHTCKLLKGKGRVCAPTQAVNH